MRLSWFPMLATLAACGRVGFDPVPAAIDGGPDAPDVLRAHDEDGDGEPDTTDNCPFVADAVRLDSDGDGVGDVCDPLPSTNTETLAVFAPLTMDDPTFTSGAPWVRNADSLHFVSTGGALQQLILTLNLTKAEVWMGFDVETCEPANRQIAIVMRDAGNSPYFYSELFDGTGSNPVLNIQFWNGSMFSSVQSLPTPSVVGQSVTLRFRQDPAGGLVSTDAQQFGGFQKAVTPFTGSNFVQIGFLNCTGNVHYVAVITSS